MTLAAPRPENGAPAPQTPEAPAASSARTASATPVATPAGQEDAVREALSGARAAEEPWDLLGLAGRREVLLRWRRVMARRMDEIIGIMGEELGKTRKDAVSELFAALTQLDWTARHAPRVLGRRRVPSGLFMQHAASSIAYRPYGVVGVIGPWNFPVLTPLGSLAPALAAGNTVVFKPSEHSPRSGDWLAETFAEAAGAHSGALRLVHGDGRAGAALTTAGVDKIAFTGSPATGARILAACAPSLTPALVELGGKDALLVAADADLKAAAEAAVWGGCFNAGQACAGIERVYVAEEVHEEFLTLVAARARTLSAPEDFGRLILPAQTDTVRRQIDDALARGARAVVGGPECVQPPYVTGPVVLADVPEDSIAVTEETFGPLLVVNAVPDMAEAVRRANASEYALGSAVFGGRGVRTLTPSLRAGMVSVNDVLTFPTVGALPFGGRGRSGFGRIHGADGLREFAVPQSRTVRRFRAPLAVASYAGRPWETEALERLVRIRMTLRNPLRGPWSRVVRGARR